MCRLIPLYKCLNKYYHGFSPITARGRSQHGASQGQFQYTSQPRTIPIYEPAKDYSNIQFQVTHYLRTTGEATHKLRLCLSRYEWAQCLTVEGYMFRDIPNTLMLFHSGEFAIIQQIGTVMDGLYISLRTFVSMKRIEWNTDGITVCSSLSLIVG